MPQGVRYADGANICSVDVVFKDALFYPEEKYVSYNRLITTKFSPSLINIAEVNDNSIYGGFGVDILTHNATLFSGGGGRGAVYPQSMFVDIQKPLSPLGYITYDLAGGYYPTLVTYFVDGTNATFEYQYPDHMFHVVTASEADQPISATKNKTLGNDQIILGIFGAFTISTFSGYLIDQFKHKQQPPNTSGAQPNNSKRYDESQRDKAEKRKSHKDKG